MRLAEDASIVAGEKLARMEAKVDRLELLLETVVNSLSLPQTVTVSDASRILGVSVSNLRGTQCYLLPDWGKSEFPDGRIRWKYETFVKHLSKGTPEELKEMYQKDMRELARKRKRGG